MIPATVRLLGMSVLLFYAYRETGAHTTAVLAMLYFFNEITLWHIRTKGR
jgi:hypothetical protein